jgi:hypothetical protein
MRLLLLSEGFLMGESRVLVSLVLLELKGERVCTDILCIEVYFRPNCGERMLHVLDLFLAVLCFNLHSKPGV